MASVLRGMGRLAGRIGSAAMSPVGLMTTGTTAACALASFQIEADAKDFFVYKFKTTKDADAIADFYSTEDFLQILGIFPLAIHFVLAGVDWDPKRENTMRVWDSMQISFDITEKEEIIDGKTSVTMFNKRERFINYIPLTNILLWDQVQNYGFQKMPDGTLEVSHHGESFHGPWPVRILVGLHSQYVIWATEKHINSAVFGTEDLEANEEHRSNIPLVVAKEWIAALQKAQGEATQKKRLQSKPTQMQQATQKTLKKLTRQDTVIEVRQMPSGAIKLHASDPEAQAALKAALKDLKDIEGKDAAGDALNNLLQKIPAKA